MAESIARRLAEFTKACSVGTLPSATLHRAKLYVLDTLGAMAAGAHEDSSRIVADAVSALGGRGVCTVVGHPFRASATEAALANGAMAHAFEIDDDHRTSALHPGAVVVPAALATAEYRNAGGKALLEGIVAGYEVMVRLGDAFRGAQDRRGFHSTGTCGVFAAAATAGRVLDLNARDLVAALGIAGSRASGLQEWKSDGSWTKRLHPGMAAEGGIISALLAVRGFSGPDTVFEGPHGFLRAYAGDEPYDANAITAGLGNEFRGAATAFKPYACCRFAHPLVDAVLRAVRAHGICADDIERCTVHIFQSGYEALFEPAERRQFPPTPVDAQFSASYIAAVSILQGPPLPDHFSEATLSDPVVLDLAGRISGVSDATYEKRFPESYPTRVTFYLRDGRQIEEFEEIADGDPAKHIYHEDPERFGREIVEKFRALVNRASAFRDKPDATERILAAVLNLAELENLANLTRHLRAGPPTDR